MRDGARIAATIELLEIVQKDWEAERPQPMAQHVSHYFRDRRFIGSKDRRFIKNLTYQVMRHYGQLCHLTHPLSETANARHLVLAHLFNDTAKINELKVEALFCDAPHHPAPLSEAEQSFFEALSTNRSDDSSLSRFYPAWIESDLPNACKTESQIHAMQQPAQVDIRSNIPLAELQEKLQMDGYQATPIQGLADALTLIANQDLTRTKSFLAGEFEIQDRGSQAVIHALPLEPNQVIIDYCAGGGGKSLAMAALLSNQATIIATDIDLRRLRNLKPRAKRAASEVNLLPIDTVDRDFVDEADLLLLDVPCSGTGTLRRHPDILWRNKEADIIHYQQLQREIIETSLPLLKTGGHLAYVTCSLTKSENEEQTDYIMRKHPELRLVSPAQIWNYLSSEKKLGGRWLPDPHESDGFYLALFQKQEI